MDIDGLDRLTRREAEILHLRCRGLKIEAIAAYLDPPITPRAVYFHLGNIYEKLGLAGVDGYERLRILNAQVCPRVSEAPTSALPAPADEAGFDQPTPAQPAEATVALVAYDEARALIPGHDGPGPTQEPVSPTEASQPVADERTFIPDGGRPMIDRRPRLKDGLLLLVGAVVGIVLALALALPRQILPARPISSPPAAVSSELSDEAALYAGRMARNPPRLPRPQP